MDGPKKEVHLLLLVVGVIMVTCRAIRYSSLIGRPLYPYLVCCVLHYGDQGNTVFARGAESFLAQTSSVPISKSYPAPNNCMATIDSIAR